MKKIKNSLVMLISCNLGLYLQAQPPKNNPYAKDLTKEFESATQDNQMTPSRLNAVLKNQQPGERNSVQLETASTPTNTPEPEKTWLASMYTWIHKRLADPYEQHRSKQEINNDFVQALDKEKPATIPAQDRTSISYTFKDPKSGEEVRMELAAIPVVAQYIGSRTQEDYDRLVTLATLYGTRLEAIVYDEYKATKDWFYEKGNLKPSLDTTTLMMRYVFRNKKNKPANMTASTQTTISNLERLANERTLRELTPKNIRKTSIKQDQ